MQARAHVGRVYNEERASVCLERGVDNLANFRVNAFGKSRGSPAPCPKSDSQGMSHFLAKPGDGYHQLPPETPTMSMTPWLDTAYYKEALDGFNIYDPTLWLPTFRFSVKGMMFWPWLLISVLTFLQALYLLEVNPDSAAAIIFPLDAHVILGGALAFLVVMRTDASMNRWWEARCSWQELMNSCISIGCQTAPALQTVKASEQMLMELMAFCVCLKAFLRDTTVQREECGGRMDWAPVRAKIATQGMRNSNVLAIAPTATISNITATSPCIEPTYKNLFV